MDAQFAEVKLEDEEDPNKLREYRIKIVVLGDSNVGKTSLLARFANPKHSGAFDVRSTIAPEAVMRDVCLSPDILVHYAVWDTAGMERFDALNRTYFRDAFSLVLVFDLSDLASFDSVYSKWYQRFVETTGRSRPPVLLIGNKNDRHVERQVSYLTASRLASTNDWVYFETSAWSAGMETALRFEEHFRATWASFRRANNITKGPTGTSPRAVPLISHHITGESIFPRQSAFVKGANATKKKDNSSCC